MPPYARLHTAPHYSSRPEAGRSRNPRVTQALSHFLPDDLSHFDGGRELSSTRDAASCISALSGARDTQPQVQPEATRSKVYGIGLVRAGTCARKSTNWHASREQAQPPRSQPPMRLPHIRALRCPARTRARTPAHERPHTNAHTRTPTHERPHHTTRKDRA